MVCCLFKFVNVVRSGTPERMASVPVKLIGNLKVPCGQTKEMFVFLIFWGFFWFGFHQTHCVCILEV